MTKKKAVKTSGSFHGKSNALGHGGRAAQLRAQGVPGGVIGELARRSQATLGQKNYHGKKKVPLLKKMKACKPGSGKAYKIFQAHLKRTHSLKKKRVV